MLSNAYSKYYVLSEHLAVDKVTVLFKGWVIFKQYIAKKHKCIGIKIYKLCDMPGYTYDMDKGDSGKQLHDTTLDMQVDKEIIPSLIGLDNSEQLPPPDFMRH
jgi:hypothetical protein